jgi:ABC-type cobalt transport system substrate-binding protein
MGGATSKTSADSIAKQLMSAISEVSATAYTRGTATNNFQLSGNCKVKGDIKQFIKLDLKTDIFQKLLNSTTTDNALSNKVSQVSTAEAPNLSFSAGADSETFTRLINDLATEIKNSTYASCSGNVDSLNNFNCTDNASFEGKLDQDVLTDFIFKCTQDISSVTAAKQKLQNFIDQHSSAKVEDVIFKILMAVAAIMLIYFLGPSLGKLLGGGGGGGGGEQSTEDKRRLRIVILLAVILLILVLVYFFVIKK